MKIFGIFSRDFFVPWDALSVVREDRFLWQSAELRFGNPLIGKLRIAANIADRLARFSNGRWPEAGSFPPETKQQAFIGVFKQWVAGTCFAALFFTLAPRLMSPHGHYPPIEVTILFPAVVLGIASVVRYFARTKK